MHKHIAGALCAGLAVVALTGCSSSEDPAPEKASASAPAAQSPSASVPAATPSETGSPTPDPSPAPQGVDQSTPEAAVTSWINALTKGRATDVCSLTAFGNQRFSDVPDGQEQCEKSLAPVGDTLKQMDQFLKGLKVEGATIEGDKANFDNAKVTPDLAEGIVKGFKAVKLDGKWYVTTG